MPDDIHTDPDPFVHIRRRVGQIIFQRMFDARTQPVNDVRAQRADIADIIVRLLEIIIARIVFIGFPVAENQLHVHQAHPRIVQRHVMKAGIRDPQGFEILVPVEIFLARKIRSEIAAVQSPDFPLVSGEINLNLHFLS